MAVKYCNFCGKHQDECKVLIASPCENYICEVCVDLAAEVVADWKKRHESGEREYESWFA